jgi:hypothetical protein
MSKYTKMKRRRRKNRFSFVFLCEIFHWQLRVIALDKRERSIIILYFLFISNTPLLIVTVDDLNVKAQ